MQIHIEEREIRGVIRNEIERPIQRGCRPYDDAIKLVDQALYLVRRQEFVIDHEHPKAGMRFSAEGQKPSSP